MLAEAAANTVRSPIDPNSKAVKAAGKAGLDVQLLYDYRCRMLHMVKAHYAEAYGQHLLSTQQVRTLQAAADKALDEAGEGLRDWLWLEPSCKLRGMPKLLRAWRVHRLSGTLVQAGVYQQQLSNLTLLMAFIDAHKHAQAVLRDHIQAVGDAPVLQALSRASVADSLASTTADPMRDLLERFGSMTGGKGGRGDAEALLVLQESEIVAAAAHSLAEGVTFSHPSLPSWLRSKQVAANILTEQHTFLQRLADAGLVQQRECMELEELMHDRFKLLLQSNSGLSAALSYSRSRPPLNLVPLFDSLDDAQSAALMKGGSTVSWGPKDSGAASSGRCHWKVFYPEQLIATAGSPIHEVIVITKGAVRMKFPRGADGLHACERDHVVVASVGDPLGVCELMLGYPRTADLTADSMVQCLMVPTDTFKQLVDTVPGVYTRAWQATAAQLAAQHHHILGNHKQLAPLNMFFRSCLVARVEPGNTFDVPRTALLLTGSVQSLTPLPANFSLAVQNPNRKASAADLLWPSNINSAWDSSASESSVPCRKSSADGSNSDVNGVAQGQVLPSIPPNTPQHSHGGPGREHAAGGQDAASSSHGSIRSSDSSAAAAADSTSTSVTVHDAAGTMPSATAADADHAGDSSLMQLVAPAELPPGEFQCIAQAMLLQVPRGPTLPGSLETITYQAQVLGKGAIHVEPMQRQGSTGTLSDQAKKKGPSVTTRSWSPAMATPLKDALSKISRKVAGDRSERSERDSASGGLQSQGSNGLPTMHFLQRAAVSMRAESLRHGSSGHGGAKHAGSAGLHTVVEIRGASMEGAAAEAAAAGARNAVAAAAAERKAAANGSAAPAAGGAVASSQPQRSEDRPDRPSLELRATDVMHGSASFRRRVVGQQQGDEAAGAEGGSPRGSGADAAAGFAARPAGQLASGGLKRRSQTYT